MIIVKKHPDLITDWNSKTIFFLQNLSTEKDPNYEENIFIVFPFSSPQPPWKNHERKKGKTKNNINLKQFNAEMKINIWSHLSYSLKFLEEICREDQMLSNVLKKLLCSFKILQLSFLYTHFPKKQVNSLRKSYIYIYVCMFKQTQNWQMDKKYYGNSQLKSVLEFWNWPVHSCSYIKMLGRGSLSCQDPPHLCYARTDTWSPWRGGDRVHT